MAAYIGSSSCHILIIGFENLDSTQILQQHINTKRSLSVENSDQFKGIVLKWCR